MIRNVSADLFRIVAAYRSSDDSRSYLHGVYVQPHPCGGAYLVATDGHRMLVVYDASAECTEAAIIACPSDLLRAAKSKPVRQRRRGTAAQDGEPMGPRMLAVIEDQAIISCDGFEVHRGGAPAVIDGTFPDWRRTVPTIDAVPAAERSLSPAFAPAYLEAFGETGRALSEHFDTSAPVRIVSCGQSAALVLFDNCREAFGVLMPMRSMAPTALPAFLDARPFAEPRVQVSPVERSNVYGRDIDSWGFTVTTTRSELHLPEGRQFAFSTEAAAKRAYMALRKKLAKRGVRALPEKYRPAIALGDAYLEALKKRAAAVADAREAFQAVEDVELEAPWRRAMIVRSMAPLAAWESPVIVAAATEAAFRRLPARSEAAALAKVYRLAA